MCGIVGITGDGPALPFLLEGLARLEYRGYDSSGVALVPDDATASDEIWVRRRPGKLAELAGSVDDAPTGAPTGIGHTRWATHGRPSEQNAHPHTDCTGSIVVVHNGILENYLAIKQALIAAGHTFKSETDTEVVAHLVEKH
ncbi:MAG: glutamine--fructose-6-phosphate transaminase (isomerizing), partial [Acidimicrobiales bacterium]